jgi:fructose-specific phosphotransferase system IIC component
MSHIVHIKLTIRKKYGVPSFVDDFRRFLLIPFTVAVIIICVVMYFLSSAAVNENENVFIHVCRN